VDPELVGGVLELVRELAREVGTTMLLVTHQMAFAREFADRVAFFHHGRVHELGPAEQVLGAPREARTREFLRSVLWGRGGAA